MEIVRITPLDVLYLRGNRLFEQAGAAEALMPPWPSLFAGAIRARMLTAEPGALQAFGRNELSGPLAAVLGSGASSPGTFRVAFSALERVGNGRASTLLVPSPADLVVLQGQGVRRAAPCNLRELGLQGSFALPDAAVLRMNEATKPTAREWLTERGLLAWLEGKIPSSDDLVSGATLWQTDPRLGIALDRTARSAKEGTLYTSDCVALVPGVSFAVGVRGADGKVPANGLLRLGGDGRGATIARSQRPESAPAPWTRLPQGDRFTMLLATPMISSAGWLPPGATLVDGVWHWQLGTLQMRIRAAALGRAGVVSGWDLAKHKPKPAKRVVPAGSVYFLERIEGDLGELARVLNDGLGLLEVDRDRAREAEGFGNVWFGEWPRVQAAA